MLPLHHPGSRRESSSRIVERCDIGSMPEARVVPVLSDATGHGDVLDASATRPRQLATMLGRAWSTEAIAVAGSIAIRCELAVAIASPSPGPRRSTSGLLSAGGNWKTLKKYARPARASRPPTSIPHAATRRRCAVRRRMPLEEILVERSTYSRSHLKRAPLRGRAEGPSAASSAARARSGAAAGSALILDHVNGVRDDNRLENLRIVCPNCAADARDPLRPKESDSRFSRGSACGVASFVPNDRETALLLARTVGSAWMRGPRVKRLGARKVERPPYQTLLARDRASSATSRSAAGTASPTTRSASGSRSTSASSRAPADRATSTSRTDLA